MTGLPQRVPGEALRKALEPPEGGWFGTGVKWPTEDQDLLEAEATKRVLARYLDGGDLLDGEAGVGLFDRVLGGVKRISPG
jgi:hypothetical protein